MMPIMKYGIEDLSDEETDEYPQADTERKQME